MKKKVILWLFKINPMFDYPCTVETKRRRAGICALYGPGHLDPEVRRDCPTPGSNSCRLGPGIRG